MDDRQVDTIIGMFRELDAKGKSFPDGVKRWRERAVAYWLDTRPKWLCELIERRLAALEECGPLLTLSPCGEVELWLNWEQVMLLAIHVDTSRAEDIRRVVVSMTAYSDRLAKRLNVAGPTLAERFKAAGFPLPDEFMQPPKSGADFSRLVVEKGEDGEDCYMLDWRQALLVTLLAETPRAYEIQGVVIKVFAELMGRAVPHAERLA